MSKSDQIPLWPRMVRGVFRAVTRDFMFSDSISLERLQKITPVASNLGAPFARFGLRRWDITKALSADVWQGASSRTLLFFHGGGFVVRAEGAHRRMFSKLAKRFGGTLIAPHYRLAPQHPFPAALDDCYTAYRAVLDDGVAPKDLVLGGESAGGNLMFALLLRLKEEGMPLPSGVVGISPALDLTGSSPSLYDNMDKDYLFTESFLRRLIAAYAGDVAAEDPRVSPLLGDLSGLPPVLLHISRDEMLADDSRRAAEKIKASGGMVGIREWPHMPHGFHTYPLFRETKEAHIDVAAFVNDPNRVEDLCP